MTATTSPPTQPAAPPLEATLLETLAQLPPAQQQAVLYFAQFLASQYLKEQEAEDLATLPENSEAEVEFSADRFEKSFRQALSGQTFPLSELWEGLEDE